MKENIMSLLSVIFGRKQFAKKNSNSKRRQPAKRTRLWCEQLEDRLVPTTTFNFLDTFSGATFANATVNSGGTDAGTGDIRVNATRPSDSGMDGAPGLVVPNTDNLRTGPVDAGVGDSLQYASTRNSMLTYKAGNLNVTGSIAAVLITI